MLRESTFTFIHRACLVIAGMLMILPRSYAQLRPSIGDSINLKMNAYKLANPAAALFAHFDKTIYTNNENVWFTAYLLNTPQAWLHHTLSVSLVNDIDRSVVMEDKFVMTSGFGFGNMFLPDSIAPGNYTFVLYTNRVQAGNKPQVLFTQPITIKTTSSSGFKAILSLRDTVNYRQGKSSNVLLTVNGDDYLPLAGADVSYKLAGADTTVIQGKARTDKTGQYLIPIPQGKNVIKVQVKNKKNSQYLYLALPQPKEFAIVKFYPEGGNLIHNLSAKVGWEVSSLSGAPLRVSGVLYQDNKPVDTITTDNYGLGKFIATPVKGSAYTVKLLGIKQKDTVYKMPPVLAQGMALNVYKALVSDTLQLQVRSSYAGTVYLNVHNYQQEFFCVPVKVDAFVGRKAKIALTGLPKGIAAVTLTDSLGRPFAERLFFAHYDQKDKLKISADKSTYNTREKVKLNISLTDTGALGAVSVACVQDNRFELKKVNDIESYFYLKNVLNGLPMREHYFADKQFLEDVLLIKGWRRYTWPELLSFNEADTLRKTSSVEMTGRVEKFGKPLKKPFNFAIGRDSTLNILTTDAAGQFSLTYDQLITNQDKLIRIMTGEDYSAKLNDPYLNINKHTAGNLVIPTYEQALSTLYTDNFMVKGFEKAIQLAEVKVVAKKDNGLFSMGSLGANACGDYVCPYNILNCPNHIGGGSNTQPVKGRQYRYNGAMYIYPGCLTNQSTEPISTLRGIYVAKQYYGSDYSVVNPTEPEYISTIFWKHLIKVEKGKSTQVSFYTSDITGKFRIVVEGITLTGVTYGESSITVKKP